MHGVSRVARFDTTALSLGRRMKHDSEIINIGSQQDQAARYMTNGTARSNNIRAEKIYTGHLKVL